MFPQGAVASTGLEMSTVLFCSEMWSTHHFGPNSRCKEAKVTQRENGIVIYQHLKGQASSEFHLAFVCCAV